MRTHGYIGIILIILAQINIFLKIQPFASWYIPIIWYGYILLVDSLVFKIKGKSLIINQPKKFLLILLISIPIWSIYELYNLFTQNWYYNEYYTLIIHLVDYTTILPAIIETMSLFIALGWFKGLKCRGISASKAQLILLISSGIIIAILPLIYSYLFFWGIWIGLFMIVDPINYLIGRDSLISDFKKKKLNRSVSLAAAALTCGFLWEFWNYWSLPKWFYNIPLVDFWHVFEMPLLGFLGYIPFAWSLFAMYNLFIKT